MDQSATRRMIIRQVPITPGNPSITLPPNGSGGADKCGRIELRYEIAPAVICAMCFIFGIVYTFFGYRFFKAVMFLTGFIFGSLVTYLICLEENLLPFAGKIGVAIAAGVLCGLITMLVQYVGLFLTGFHFGVFLAVASLIVMEQFYHPDSKWIPIGILCGLGTLCALFNLYFQKGLTILGTGIFGAGLMVVALDYYIESFALMHYILERIKAERSQQIVCWFSWVILGLWPLAALVGIIAQWRVTGNGVDHNEVVKRRKRRQVNMDRLRTQAATQGPAPTAASTAPTERYGTIHSRYRHLYQIRRCNGDVISQNYIHGMQTRLSPAMRNFVMRDNGQLEHVSSQHTQLPVHVAR